MNSGTLWVSGTPYWPRRTLISVVLDSWLLQCAIEFFGSLNLGKIANLSRILQIVVKDVLLYVTTSGQTRPGQIIQITKVIEGQGL